MTEQETTNSNKLSTFSIILIKIAFLFIVFAFFAPYLLTEYSWLALSDDSPLGDTLGGIMNPFIAIGAAILTFLAFYMQFKANKQQRDQFTIELKEQREQFSKSQFETQFFEMLRLHKENVNELEIDMPSKTEVLGIRDQQNLKGRKVFSSLLDEFHSVLFIINCTNKELSVKEKVELVYPFFFDGYSAYEDTKVFVKLNSTSFKVALQKLMNEHNIFGGYEITQTLERVTGISLPYKVNYPLLRGHSSQLGHYYRHLFQTVKFVCSQPSELIDYQKKRDFLRILRAQLSNEEQILLFYNWMAEYGSAWENNVNKYFTDYRMIHNLNPDLLLLKIDLPKLLNPSSREIKKEKGKDHDPLFDFLQKK